MHDTALARFEKHSSVTSENSAIAKKLFVGLFVNTAVIVLLVNTRWRSGPQLSGSQLFVGQYADFTAEWFSTVGASIFFTLVLNTANPHLVPVLAIPWRALRRRWYRTRAKTQAQLNEVYAGAKFRLAERCKRQRRSAAVLWACLPRTSELRTRVPDATVMNAFFCTLLYSPGLPLLYPVAAATFAFMYACDRISFLRYYAKPERFDSRLARETAAILPWAVVLHCFLAVWFFSAPPLTNTGSTSIGQAASALSGASSALSVGERLSLLATFPHLLLGLLVLVFLLARMLLRLFYGTSAHFPIPRVLRGGSVAPVLVSITLTEARAKAPLESYHLVDQLRYADGARRRAGARVLCEVQSN